MTLIEHREAGLVKANRIIAERRLIRDSIEAGNASLADFIRAEPSEALRNAKLGLLLRWQPGIGKGKAKKVLDRMGLSTHQHLRELNFLQRYKLADYVEAKEK